MRLYIVGAGGVGNALARLLATRNFYDQVVIADYDPTRSEAAVSWIAQRHPDKKHLFSASTVDASSPTAITQELRDHNATWVVNAVEPGFVESIFQGAFDAGVNYLDMAMSLSSPHPTDPHNKTGVMLGDWQFQREQQWLDAGRLAIVGMGVEPGLSDVFARFAQDELFSDIDEIGVRDGANLVVTDADGNEIFAPSFSIWTTIEECLNPPVVWEKNVGWFTTEPFSEPEVFNFPEGIGPVECVNVEHEEVILMPRWLNAKRVTFKYGLGEEFISVLKTLHTLGLDKTTPTTVRTAPDAQGRRGTAHVSPRDVVAAVLPDPAEIGPVMTGKTCAGVWVTGTGKDGSPQQVYIYHVADNQWTMEHFDTQCVVWQTALGPAVALECVANGTWSGVGIMGPEAFDSSPFLELMSAETSAGGYGQAFGVDHRA